MASESGGWLGELGKGAAGAIGTALGGAAFLWLMGWLSPLWSWTQNAFGSLWTHLMAQSQWPNWSAYLVSLLAASAWFLLARRHWRNRKDSTWRFNQLSFLGVVWRWDSTSGLPSAVLSYCPACDTRLVYEQIPADHYFETPQRLLLHCETCGCERFRIDGNLAYMNARIIREIDRLHRTGEWKKHVAD